MISDWASIILAIFVTLGIFTIAGKIIWNWLTNQGSVPMAKNGFLTSEQHEILCKRQLELNRQLICADIQKVISPINDRLTKGDFTFADHVKRFDMIDKTLNQQSRALIQIYKEVRKKREARRKTD